MVCIKRSHKSGSTFSITSVLFSSTANLGSSACRICILWGRQAYKWRTGRWRPQTSRRAPAAPAGRPPPPPSQCPAGTLTLESGCRVLGQVAEHPQRLPARLLHHLRSLLQAKQQDSSDIAAYPGTQATMAYSSSACRATSSTTYLCGLMLASVAALITCGCVVSTCMRVLDHSLRSL